MDTQQKRNPTGTIKNPALAQKLLEALDTMFGLHPGFRPAQDRKSVV